MTTRPLIDPELRPLLELFPSTTATLETLGEIRQGVAALQALMPLPATAATLREQVIPGPSGAPDVRVVIYTPAGQATGRPGLLHTHGGGYILGAPEMSSARLLTLADELGCVVVSVDYRLAPEHPYPAPVEDAYAALTWFHQHAGDLGVDPAKIAIGGESAGGGLAAALGLLARDRGEVPVCFQLLIYPMLDDRTCTAATPNPNTGEFIWTREANHFGWSSLLGQAPGAAQASCYAAPARAETVAGLPPTFIAVGALDLFLEEDIAYAQRLLHAGIATELHVYPGAFHAFDMMAPAQVAQQFERDFRGALRRAWA